MTNESIKKKKAIFIPVKDENFFIHKWKEYYSKHFSKKDMYVLYYGDDQEYLKNFSDINVISVTEFTVTNYNDQIVQIYEKNHQTYQKLLEEYQYVLMAEADEFIYHPDGLGNYIDSMQDDFVTCTGFEMIHMKDSEPPFDYSRKIMDQRKYWYFDSAYFSKSLITSRMLQWNVGNHKISGEPRRMDPNLILVHMHKFDYDRTRKNHLRCAEMKWSEETLRTNMAWHYRIKEQEKFDEWFYSRTDCDLKTIPVNHQDSELKIIPQEIRDGIDV